MPLEVIAGDNFRITGRPGFERVVFTRSSPFDWIRPKAIALLEERGGVLQSTREAAAFRIEADSADDAGQPQITRTIVMYFRHEGRWYAAVDDISDPQQNITLAQADEGYRIHQRYHKFAFLKKDARIRDLLARAEKAGRVFGVSDQISLELTTEQTDGMSAFGQYEGNKAILGDVSEDYATFLARKGLNKSTFRQLTPERLERLMLGDDKVEIRLSGLGDYGSFYLGGITAWDECCDSGPGRGVRYLSQ